VKKGLKKRGVAFFYLRMNCKTDLLLHLRRIHHLLLRHNHRLLLFKQRRESQQKLQEWPKTKGEEKRDSPPYEPYPDIVLF